MNARSKDEIRDIVLKDLILIHDRRVELSKRLSETFEDNVSYVRDLYVQLSQPTSGPFVPKTPKMRKRAVQRIETIPEDEVFQQEITSSSLQSVREEEEQKESETSRRTRRGASKRAADNIKKQSFILNNSIKKVKRDSQIKRKKSARSSSSSEDNGVVSKYSKVEEKLNETAAKESTKRVIRKKSKQIAQLTVPIEEETKKSQKVKEDDNFELPVLQQSSRTTSSTASFKSSQNKEVNKTNDTIAMPSTDDIEEPSMYEDAIGKLPVPIMNSTLKHSLFTSDKVLNATVVLERLPQQPRLNETVVIQKAANTSKELKERQSIKKIQQDNTQAYKAPVQDNDCNGLITDDESSPEVKKSKKQLNRKQANKKQIKELLTSSEDEIPNTPVKTRLRDAVVSKVAQESKATYKSNALFSPYAKESVKKRVEAFEQAVMYSPKSVDVDAPTRVTRTKTRAMATAETETKNAETKNVERNVTQILARKSLVKAKRISLAKQKKNDEFKEVKESVNKEQLPERINKLLLAQTDKSNVKQIQQLKTTPLSKLKLMQPILSVNRLHTPLNMQNPSNYSKTVTGSRVNIVTGMDTFIQPPKSVTKTNSVDKLEERRRHEEDARKKREEALRLQTEEKRRKRQEKELKNKLAREAKEKQELEKRQKAEKEKEEKAKLALMMQEKQREELEKKRQALLQRAQEKEERRKLEEQQRLQRIQEQEETERLLAEQRRREQEIEKRKEAEARAQAAEAEKQKHKNQLLATQAKYKQQANNKYEDDESYIIDSEPDDDESDDESKPRRPIPRWALPHVRHAQLALQVHIPETIVYKFFDTRKCTPDLTELFHGIDRSRLKRTSSAIWKTDASMTEPKLQPRASMMEPETEFEPKIKTEY